MNNLVDIITTKQDPDLGRSLRSFVGQHIVEFTKVLLGHKGSALGGISVAETFWLYYLLKALQPKQIIESGTFHGYSLYFIVEAVTWPCRIFSFDPDLSNAPRYKGVEYHEHDWMLSDKGFLEGDDTFIFFDDHIDHDQRLYEAARYNQRHLLFHDNYLTTTQSHYPVRFCDLTGADFCYTLPGLYGDPIFTDTEKNAQTYRWLTYVRSREYDD